jgi:hypothetical protein
LVEEKVATGHRETGGSSMGRVTDRKVTGLRVMKETNLRVRGSRQAAGPKAIADRSRDRVADRKEIGRHARKVASHRETGLSKTREASPTRTDLSNKVISHSKMLIISKIDNLNQRSGRRMAEAAGHKARHNGTAIAGTGVTVRKVTGLQDLTGISLPERQVRRLHRYDYYYDSLPAKSV